MGGETQTSVSKGKQRECINHSYLGMPCFYIHIRPGREEGVTRPVVLEPAIPLYAYSSEDGVRFEIIHGSYYGSGQVMDVIPCSNVHLDDLVLVDPCTQQGREISMGIILHLVHGNERLKHSLRAART